MLCGMSTNETINRSIDRFTIPIMVFVSHQVQLLLERYMCPRCPSSEKDSGSAEQAFAAGPD